MDLGYCAITDSGDEKSDDDNDSEDDLNYQEILDMLEDSDLSPLGEKVLRDYRYAIIALSVEEQNKMYVLHYPYPFQLAHN